LSNATGHAHAGRIFRLSCTDRAQRSRRTRACHGAMGHALFVHGTKKRAAKLKAKGSSSTSMNCYGWSPTVQQRISATSVASTGLDGWRSKTVASYHSIPSASLTRASTATSGSHSTRRVALPASPASGSTGRGFLGRLIPGREKCDLVGTQDMLPSFSLRGDAPGIGR